MLVPLGRCEHLPLDLANVAPHRLAEATLTLGLDLLARGWLQVFVQLLDLGAGKSQTHRAFGDPRDLCREDVARLPEGGGRHRQAVEDVLGVVAGDFVDVPDLFPVGGDDIPSRL